MLLEDYDVTCLVFFNSIAAYLYFYATVRIIIHLQIYISLRAAEVCTEMACVPVSWQYCSAVSGVHLHVDAKYMHGIHPAKCLKASDMC